MEGVLLYISLGLMYLDDVAVWLMEILGHRHLALFYLRV